MILKPSRYIRKPKKHYLVPKVVVSSLKGYFLFIILFYPHPMVSTYEIKLDELFGST